jgi:2-(1,2-epoxy-1,2-dihydrophenyl)acetyl-CoA isomerase
MLGDKINAKEAERLGMIYKCVSSKEYDATLEALALKLAKMPTKALGVIKVAFNQSLENDLEKQLDVEMKYQIEASETEDYAEGVAAFIEKRKPNFKGR